MESAQSSFFFYASWAARNFVVGQYACDAGKIGLLPLLDDRTMRPRGQMDIAADTAALRVFRKYGRQPTSRILPFRVLWAHLLRYQVFGRIVGVRRMQRGLAAACVHVLVSRLHRWHLKFLRRRAGR